MFQIDGLENEIDGIKTKDYPTIGYLAKGSEKKPVKFDGERTVDAVLAFVEVCVHTRSTCTCQRQAARHGHQGPGETVQRRRVTITSSFRRNAVFCSKKYELTCHL